MGDCDIPLYKNIFQTIKKIKDKKYYFISPYNFIEKLSIKQTNFIYKNNVCLNVIASKFQKTPDKNPYSFSGGILVVNRLIFENMGLWFEMVKKEKVIVSERITKNRFILLMKMI